MFNAFITSHNKKFDLYLVDCDLKIDFNKVFKPCFRTDFYHNTTNFNLKIFLIYWIDKFTRRGYKLLHINEMNIITINDKRNMTYEHFIEQPMQMVEIKLEMILSKNPHLITSVDRIIIESLIRKYSKIPLFDQII